MNRKNITVLLLAAVLLSASSCGNSEKILESTKEETAAEQQFLQCSGDYGNGKGNGVR